MPSSNKILLLGADHAGGAERDVAAAALLPGMRIPQLEPGRSGGDDLGVPRPAPHLHQAQGGRPFSHYAPRISTSMSFRIVQLYQPM